ncbi:hypothetical protein BJ170DRAFT_601582 [Xylariales sp. AK1849]|nr:hypothetical protein BJ170DRAFT_601582 [Xylariales sp. AK1849]
MAIVREPSQRTRAWMKWSYGQKSSNTSLASAPTEIVHLGGCRVGTPDLSYKRPNTAHESARPVTIWFPAPYFSAPEPPIGVARSRTDPQELPFPVAVATPASFETMSSTYSPAPVSVLSVGSPAMQLENPTGSFSKAKSPPLYQSQPPHSTRPANSSTMSSNQLRQTQSTTGTRKLNRLRSTGLPLMPLEATVGAESDPLESPDIKHVGRLVKEDPRVTQWFPLPQLTSPPPTKPLPAIRKSLTPDGAQSKTAMAELIVVKPAAKAKRVTSRHSPQERLWLHRNYRGELTFLKAWGLDIEKEEERVEGSILMKELMESEDEKNRLKKAQKAKD